MIKKIIIILSLALFAAAAVSLFYFAKHRLPAKINAYLVAALEDTLGYNAQIGDIRYHLVRGVVIKDIIIYDKTQTIENTILKVKEASFNFLFLPLLRQQKVIIPIIHLHYPHINIRYNQDGSLNFQKALLRLREKERGTEKKLNFSLLVYKINISHAQCAFEDRRREPALKKKLVRLNIGAALSLPAKISFLLQGDLPLREENYAKVFIKGNYAIKEKELNAQINLTGLPFEELDEYLKLLPLNIDAGTIEKAAIELRFKDNLLSSGATISAKGVRISKDGLRLASDINIEPHIEYDFSKKELKHSVDFGLLEAQIEGIDFIEKVDEITGNIRLDKESVSSDGISLKTLNSDFNLRGNINFDTSDIWLDFTSQNADLETIFSLLEPPEDIKLAGISSLNVDVKGNLEKIPLEKKAVFNIEEAFFRGPFLKEQLQNIKGEVILSEEGVDWQGLSFQYRGLPYSASGKMRDFKTPRLDFDLNNKDLRLKSRLIIDGKDIQVESAQGKYLGISFELGADINIEKEDNPYLEAEGRLKIDIAESTGIFPEKISQNLKKIKTAGTLDIDFIFMGEAKNYPGWKIDAKTYSEDFSIYGLKFSRLSFDLQQRDGALQVPSLTSSLYSGEAKASLRIDLNPQNPVYTFYFDAKDIDLSKLKSDIGLKDKDISGIVNMDANLRGELKNLETMKGLGFIHVREGKLWQIKLFRGLGELFLIPDYKKIIFNKAEGEFEIEHNHIASDNLRLESPQLILDCAGKMSFDGKLDFTIYTAANKELIRDSVDIRKFLAAIVGELSGAIAIKLSGTTKDPKFRMVPMPIDLIRNIKNFILGR